MERKLLLSIFLLSLHGIRVYSDSVVPCYFIFGDSTADNGNNNNRLSLAKINYFPYGIDFPNSVATGRYTNGLNLVDFIAQYLGFTNFIPPFATANGPEIRSGVNYANGGGGIRNESGDALGGAISFSQQLDNHKTTINSLIGLLGIKRVKALLRKCLYTVNIGSNDYGNNYFLPFFQTRLLFTPEQYAIALIQQLSSQLKILHKDGARKVALFGVGSLGCTPFARSKFPTYGKFCAEKIDNIIELFNVRLKSLVSDLNAILPGAKFTFINSTATPISGENYKVNIESPCCIVGIPRVQCVPGLFPCRNRSDYLFWDGVHYTQVGFSAVASAAFNPGIPNGAYPYYISELLLL